MLYNKYDIALNMMIQGEDGVSKRIRQFAGKIPTKLINKIKDGKVEGSCIENDKRWTFYDAGDALSIVVGSVNNESKDYMTLHLREIEHGKIDKLLPFFGVIPVGYVTFYLYNPEHKREKPLQLTYDATLKRTKEKHLISFNTRTNPFMSDNQEIIEKNGFMDLFEEEIKKGSSQIDVQKVYGIRANKK